MAKSFTHLTEAGPIYIKTRLREGDSEAEIARALRAGDLREAGGGQDEAAGERVESACDGLRENADGGDWAVA